jgi:hypothetical protein
MSDGWLAFAVIACIVICTGSILAVVVMRASLAQKEREMLTSSDLRALEESTLYLIDQLKSESEHAISELESRRLALAEVLDKTEKQTRTLKELLASAENLALPSVEIPTEDPKREDVLSMAMAGVDSSEIARKAGIDCAEVKLMLRLAGVK